MIQPPSSRRFIALWTLLAFLVNFWTLPPATAQELILPAAGVMVHLSPRYNPSVLKGIKVNPNNPLRFDFILDKGDAALSNQAIKDESNRLIKYFLVSLTVPEKDLWVNLSPFEKDRIIPETFGITEMGRDLLAEDYLLKQITASLIYPEGETGKKFWKRIYDLAAQKFHTTQVPVNTFNKVWIVPEKAIVYENAQSGTAYIVDSKLKVMLEEDYLARMSSPKALVEDPGIAKQILREIVIPELTKEVNEGKNFAPLRQIYQSLILANWYKKKIKDSILSQVYADKNKVKGSVINNPQEKQQIYQRYLQAFKKGVYNFIKDDIDVLTKQMIPRKYFSGGMLLQFGSAADNAMVIVRTLDDAQLANAVQVTADLAMTFKEYRDDAQITFIKWNEIGNSIAIFEDRLAREAQVLGYATNEKTRYILHLGNKVNPPSGKEGRSQFYRLFNHALQSIGSDLIFIPANTEESELNQVLDLGYRSTKVVGFNVTSPHKEIVFKGLNDDEKDDTARISSSVNGVVKLPDGTRRGLTSDGVGWVFWYTHYLKKSLDHKKILILGSGGATRSVAMAIIDQAPTAQIVLNDLDQAKAEQLKNDILVRNPDLIVQTARMDAVNDAIKDADMVLNFTGSGKSFDDRGKSIPNINYDLLKDKEAIDANYRFYYPGAENEFLKNARAAGAEVYNGLGLLVGNLPPLFKAFTGVNPDFDELMRFAKDPNGLNLQEAGEVDQAQTSLIRSKFVHRAVATAVGLGLFYQTFAAKYAPSKILKYGKIESIAYTEANDTPLSIAQNVTRSISLTPNQVQEVAAAIEKNNNLIFEPDKSLKPGQAIDLGSAVASAKALYLLNNAHILKTSPLNVRKEPIEVDFLTKIKDRRLFGAPAAYFDPYTSRIYVDVDAFPNLVKETKNDSKNETSMAFEIYKDKSDAYIFEHILLEMIYHESVHSLTTSIIRTDEFDQRFWKDFTTTEAFKFKDRYRVAEELSAYLGQISFSEEPMGILKFLTTMSITPPQSAQGSVEYIYTGQLVVRLLANELGYLDWIIKTYVEALKKQYPNLPESKIQEVMAQIKGSYNRGDYFSKEKASVLGLFLSNTPKARLKEAAKNAFEKKFQVKLPASELFKVPSEVIKFYSGGKEDKEMKAEKTGGIDLTSDEALRIQNSGEAIKFHIDPAVFEQLRNASGFVPVIIDVKPLKDLQVFLDA